MSFNVGKQKTYYTSVEIYFLNIKNDQKRLKPFHFNLTKPQNTILK